MGLLLLTQVALGVTGGWDLNRTLGVVTAVAIGLSFLLQIRDVRRRQSATDQHQEAIKTAEEYDRRHGMSPRADLSPGRSTEGDQGGDRE
ncbi:hypothetical protein [Kocuria rosea]|uniref:Uncharacterized protein n=1 Tax=Kocuria rosea TaxID=1275 RepID=A0A4R5YSZ5_KOCRO|nr:hypothetical protein [Kocuria rosea]TDL46497.1 hypothetical protein E2R59_00280 [Kocuria rosea]